MRARTLAGYAILVASLVVLGTPERNGTDGELEWGVPTASAQKKSKSKKRASKKKTKRARRGFHGHGVKKEALRTEPVPRPSGEVWIYAVNFREEIKVNIYDDDGEFDEEALAQLDGAFRCKRSGEVRAVDPRLYETLSVVFDHFGGKRIELHSGFRFQRNEGSRHYHASAMDISIPGVSARELYKFAESLDPGGMGIGIYPRSGFVHIDWRAPGDPSYRWTDYSGPSQPSRKKRKPSS